MSATFPTWLTDQPLSFNQDEFAIKRKQAWQLFLQMGLPTRHDERWKYADLHFLTNKPYIPATQKLTQTIEASIAKHRLPADAAILLVCVNGRFIPALSDLKHVPSEMIVCDLQTAIEHHPKMIDQALSTTETDKQQYPFAALNMAMASDGIFIYQPKHCPTILPIQVLSLTDETAPFIAHPMHCMLIENKLTLIETYYTSGNADYFINTALYLALGNEAVFKHDKVQQDSLQATHIAHTFVKQSEHSDYKLTNLSKGARFARDEVNIQLLGQGAVCSTAGFYAVQHQDQYIDHHIDVTHAAAHTNSEMLYKGIVDKKGRAVFNGRLLVKEGAQKIAAYQANHHLLLAQTAEAYSKPELEIYADDVKCKHGATTGQLDQEALFYLRARGIDHDAAKAILLEGFAEEVIQRMEIFE